MSYINGKQWTETARASRPKTHWLWIASFCPLCGKISIPGTFDLIYVDTNDPKHPRIYGFVCPNCQGKNMMNGGYLKGKAVSLN